MSAPSHPSGIRSVRQPVLLGLFTGVAVGVGYLLAGVPNVELMTLVIALAGATLGAARGALVGAVAAVVYSLVSPFGLAAPPLLAAQALGMAWAGVLGRALGAVLEKSTRPGTRLSLAGATGVLAALVFDLLTNLGVIVGYDLDPRVVLGGALGFNLIHMGSVGASFAAVFPALAPRLRLLVRSSLVGRSAVLALALLLAGGIGPARAADEPSPAPESGAAPADTSMAAERHLVSGLPAPTDGPAASLGWDRPLWEPFTWNSLDWYDWYSPRLAVREAGIGGAAVIFGEAGTSPAPLVTVDGVPWGTGHALVDDPWLVPVQGLDVRAESWFGDGLGGTAGLLDLRTADPDPDKAVSEYRGVKGRHESYMRGIHLLTPRADWRAAFAFEEVIDYEVWNYTDLPDEIFRPDPEVFTGHGKVRQSRARISRLIDDDTGVDLEVSTGRVTRNDAPAWGAKHREVWDAGVSASLHGVGAGLRWRTILHWRDRDVQWGAPPAAVDSLNSHRKVESSREGVTISLVQVEEPPPAATADTNDASAAVPPPARADEGPRGFFLDLAAHNWRVADTVDTLQALPPLPGPTGGRGRSAVVDVGERFSLGFLRLEAVLGGRWDDRAGVAPAGRLVLSGSGVRPAWRLEIARDGRGPRSDELLTPVFRPAGLGAEATMLPNPDLGFESTWRAGAACRVRFLGNELALDAGARRLRDGIGWQTLPGEIYEGRWENVLELDSARLTAQLSRQGRFLGWGRIMLEGTWRAFDEKQGQAPQLPPKDAYRLHLFWENHFFQEDGILQMGLISTRRGAMDDPWDVTRTTHLPSRTVHDLLVGIRLVGVELSLAFRNLLGERVPLSYLTTSNGQEVDMRLHWTFRY